MSEPVDAQYRIAMFGEASVGKTWFVETYKREQQKLGPTTVATSPTVSVDFYGDLMTLPDDDLKIKLLICDTSGRPVFHSIVMNFIRGACIDAFLIFFVINARQTFEQATTNWLKKIKEDIPSIPGFVGYSSVNLVGTKCDLEKEREVSQERAQIVADQLGLRYFEVSSYNNYNISSTLSMIAKEVHRIRSHNTPVYTYNS